MNETATIKLQVPWLSRIPVEWPTRRLKELFRTLSGGTPSKEVPEFWLGDVPWVSPKDMKSDVVHDTMDHISHSAIAESATTLVPADTLLLVTRSGILQHTIPVAITAREVTINQDIRALVPRKPNVVPSYYAAFIRGFQAELLAFWRKQGATVESLETDLIGETVVPVPSVAHQHAIAAFLDRETAKIDALIAKHAEFLACLDEHRLVLVTEAVTRGLDASVAMRKTKDAFVSLVPAHWGLHQLRHLLAMPLAYGTNEAGDQNILSDARYVRITDVAADGSLREETRRSLPWATAKPYLLDEGDVLLARSGATVGKSFIYQPSWGACCFAGYLIRARCNIEKLQARFLNHVLASNPYWDWVASIQTQATIQNISADRYASLRIPVPPAAEQIAIVDYIAQWSVDYERLRSKSVAMISALNERRAALITAAVTGQLDISDQPLTEAAD